MQNTTENQNAAIERCLSDIEAKRGASLALAQKAAEALKPIEPLLPGLAVGDDWARLYTGRRCGCLRPYGGRPYIGFDVDGFHEGHECCRCWYGDDYQTTAGEFISALRARLGDRLYRAEQAHDQLKALLERLEGGTE